jgi:hypothetical protein
VASGAKRSVEASNVRVKEPMVKKCLVYKKGYIYIHMGYRKLGMKGLGYAHNIEEQG